MGARRRLARNYHPSQKSESFAYLAWSWANTTGELRKVVCKQQSIQCFFPFILRMLGVRLSSNVLLLKVILKYCIMHPHCA